MNEHQSNTFKVLKGMSSQTLVTIVLGVVEIVSFSIMSRLLSQEDFGYYAAVSAVVLIFECFSTAGIGSAVIQKKDASDKYINVAFTTSLILGVIVMLVLMVTAKQISILVSDETMYYPLVFMATTIPLHCLTSINRSLMHRKLEFLKLGIISLISMLLTTIVSIVLAYKGYGYYAIIVKAVVGAFISCFLSFLFVKRKYKLVIEKEEFHTIFSFSGWLTISVFLRNVAEQLDRLLMSNLLSVSILGAYNRPKEFIIQISSKLNGIFDTALFPILSDIQDDYTKIRSAYNRSLYYMNLFSLFIACSFIFNSGLIIRFFFGEEWMSVQSTFIIISLSLVFNIDGRLADCFLRSLGWTKQQFFFRVFELVLSIIGIIISYRWGVNGIASAVLLTSIILIILKNLYIVRHIGLYVSESLVYIFSSWKIGLTFIPLMSLLLYLFPNSLWGNILTAISFCILSILIFICFPSLVGNKYKNEVYTQLIKFIKLKSKRLNEDFSSR